MTSQKNTAYDYILELLNDKKIDSWTKKVITTYLNNHEQVTDEEKECLISELLSGGGSPLELSAQYSTSNEDSTVTLKSLKHVSGVNALADKEDDGISRPCPYEGGSCIVSIDDDVWIKSGYQKNKPTK